MSSPGAQETEAENIDNALQEFARSLLLQAQGKKLVGEYCTSFFTTMMFVPIPSLPVKSHVRRIV